MRNRGKGMWLAGGLVAAVLAVLVGWLAVANLAQAAVSELKIGSATVAPGEEVTVTLTADTTDPGIGSYGLNVTYDGTKLSFVQCSSSYGGICGLKVSLGANTVRVSGSLASGGIVGQDKVLGTFTFRCLGTATGTANLDLWYAANEGDVTDPNNVNISTSPTDGDITCAAPATATPTPTPTSTPPAATATPTPTKTVTAQPPTGGAPSDSGPSAALLLGVMGLALAAIGSGAWALSRTRRQSR